MNLDMNLVLMINLIVIFALLQFASYRRFQSVIKQQDKKIQGLKNDIQALLLCARGIGEKLHHQQHDFKLIQDRQDKLEFCDVNNETPYQQIQALLNRGASADEMMDSCDLTRGEIELLSCLQKRQVKPAHKRVAAVA